MDTTKKISFGFNKLNRKTNILLNKEPAKQENSKVQLIEYLEEQSIKVIGDENNIPVGPLIIPMKAPNKNLINLVDIVKNDFKDTIEENKDKTADNADTRDEKTLTLDELAAKELINGTCNKNTKLDITKVIEVSATDKVTFDGEKESSLDDYESVPVDQFGKAMLRGMGWKDGEGIGKNQQLVKVAQPVIRPKGMGLGADSLTKKTTDTPAAVDRNGKVLTCVKGAHVKVIAGYHKGYYGQIMGFDDESGRFIIKLTLSNINVSLNEFLVTPVTKQDYEKNSKVLNNAKYEEYLKHREHKEEYTKHKEQKEEYSKHKEQKEEYTKHKEQKHNTKQRTEKQVKTEPEERTEAEIKKERSYSSDDEQHSKKKDTKVKKEQDNDNSARKEVKKEKEHDQRTQNHEDSRRKHREGKHKSKERSKHNKDKNAKKNDRYSTSESEAEDSKRTNKYDSSDEYERNRTARRNSNNRKTKKTSRKHKSDEEYDNKQERRTHSNRRYSDSESEDRKKRNSEEYERKSRKHSRNKRYNSTDTDSEERYEKKQHKKEKYRDRSKHSSKDKRK